MYDVILCTFWTYIQYHNLFKVFFLSFFFLSIIFLSPACFLAIGPSEHFSGGLSDSTALKQEVHLYVRYVVY